MKRILLVSLLLTATCTVSFVQQATAQAPAPTHIKLADFTAKVNLMDSQIGAGNTTAAKSTWSDILSMIVKVFAASKESIRTAASQADKDSHMAILKNQNTIYQGIIPLKEDLVTNRAALHTQLVAFGATIY